MQGSTVASLECGAYIPPLKTLALPPLDLKGMDEGGIQEMLSVRIHIAHHKNDRKCALGDLVVLNIPDPTFLQCWRWLMGSCSIFGFKICSPSFASNSTIFISEFRYSMIDLGCEVVAVVMGNSVRTWDAHYHPSRKRRFVDLAVSTHNNFINKPSG